MKSRAALLAAVCLSVFGWSYLVAQPVTLTTAAVAAEAPRTPDPDPSRGLPRTPEIEATTTTTEAPTTTTTVAPTTTTTAKPKPKPTVPPKPKVTAAPQPKPKPAPTGNYMDLISKYPWDTAHAYRIMMCESGGNPNAINKSSGATGLFQIHPGGSKYLDPATNVATAYSKYQARGWAPWVCKA